MAGATGVYNRDPEYYNQMGGKYARDGLTDKEIGTKFGVTEQTINNWKNKHPKFKEELRQKKAFVDSKVEGSLLKSALGQTYEETTQEIRDSETGRVTIVRKHKRQLAPNVTAIKFWLNNRDKEHWRDKHEIDHTSGGEKITGFNVIIGNETTKKD
jgi:transposase